MFLGLDFGTSGARACAIDGDKSVVWEQRVAYTDADNQTPQDWRARLALSKHLAAQSRHREALDHLLEAFPMNPHGLAIHQQIWQTLSALGLDPALVRRYMALTSDAVFYLDPHVCTRCRYRSTELLWQCPQCHEWNTFVEERLSPAKDSPTEVEVR